MFISDKKKKKVSIIKNTILIMYILNIEITYLKYIEG